MEKSGLDRVAGTSFGFRKRGGMKKYRRLKILKGMLGRISGPLLDRIDIHVPAVKFRELAGDAHPETDSWQTIRNRLIAARDCQLKRFSVSNCCLLPAEPCYHASIRRVRTGILVTTNPVSLNFYAIPLGYNRNSDRAPESWPAYAIGDSRVFRTRADTSNSSTHQVAAQNDQRILLNLYA
jgi:hypothetical protein